VFLLPFLFCSRHGRLIDNNVLALTDRFPWIDEYGIASINGDVHADALADWARISLKA
jgi:hypothetical protein